MLYKIIGQKYVSMGKAWLPSLATWGCAGGVAMLYFTDWRVIMDYVPYINGKYKKDD